MAVVHKIKTKDGTADVSLTPMKAIRLKCMDCCCWQRSEVTRCASVECPLWPFRSGHVPGRKPRRGGNSKIAEIRKEFFL